MPMLDVRKLMGALLIGCGGGEGSSSSLSSSLTKKSRRDALNNLRYRDLHGLLRIDEDLNKTGHGQSLYGSGRNHHQVGQKRRRGDAHDINDDEEQELALQAKHAKLFEYYNKYKEHQEERLQALLTVDNPLKKMNQTDYYNIKSYLDDYKNGLIKDLGKTYDLRPGLHDTGLLFASDWFRQNHAVFIAVTRHRIDMNPLLIAVTQH